MPRRDGAPGLQQTRISLKLDNTPINRRAAAKPLQTLEGQLSTGALEWAYWLDETAGSITWREAIAKLYRARVVLGRTGESTWQVNDLGRLVPVPTDAEITAWVEGAPDPVRFYWGMMATYGLRPHEIEGSVLIERDLCQVAEGTKTGFRTVVPLPREWVKRFELRDKGKSDVRR